MRRRRWSATGAAGVELHARARPRARSSPHEHSINRRRLIHSLTLASRTHCPPHQHSTPRTREEHALKSTTWTYPQLPAQSVAPQTQVTSPGPAFGATNTNDTGIPAASQTTLARVRHPEGSDGVPGDRLGCRARCTLETARLVWRDLVSVFDWMGGGGGSVLFARPRHTHADSCMMEGFVRQGVITHTHESIPPCIQMAAHVWFTINLARSRLLRRQAGPCLHRTLASAANTAISRSLRARTGGITHHHMYRTDSGYLGWGTGSIRWGAWSERNQLAGTHASGQSMTCPALAPPLSAASERGAGCPQQTAPGWMTCARHVGQRRSQGKKLAGRVRLVAWASAQCGLGLSAREYDLRLVPCRPSSARLDRLDPPLLASSSPMIARRSLLPRGVLRTPFTQMRFLPASNSGRSIWPLQNA